MVPLLETSHPIETYLIELTAFETSWHPYARLVVKCTDGKCGCELLIEHRRCWQPFAALRYAFQIGGAVNVSLVIPQIERFKKIFDA